MKKQTIESIKEAAMVEVRSHGAFGESERYYRLDEDLFAELLIKECARLIDGHALQLRKFNFETNAITAESCSGMLLEHFGLKKENELTI